MNTEHGCLSLKPGDHLAQALLVRLLTAPGPLPVRGVPTHFLPGARPPGQRVGAVCTFFGVSAKWSSRKCLPATTRPPAHVS